MGNLIEIQAQIKKLQRQADEIKAKEFNSAVQEILIKMEAYGIVPRDLQPVKVESDRAKLKAQVSKKKGNAKKVAVAPKYRGPNGELWSGRGLMPRWIRALVDQGHTKEEFFIKS